VPASLVRVSEKMEVETSRRIVDLLRAVARGELDGARALEQWPDKAEENTLFAAAWHNLSHFVNDEDIRKKDEAYQEYQAETLLRNADEIDARYGVRPLG
jgi:Lon protease-like protein